VVAGCATVAVLAAAAPASAKGYGAISGTTSNKSYTNWAEFNTGGIKNNSTSARDWLMPINGRAYYCSSGLPCTVKATFKGGGGGSSCVRAYRINNLGAITGSIGPVCQDTTLATRTIGTFKSFFDGLLVVANLGGTGGAMTTVQITDHFEEGLDERVGAIHGSTAAFDSSNWGEYGIGGIRNKSTSQRDWLISVPNPHSGDTPELPGATYGGGFGGDTCLFVYSVDAFGAAIGAGASACHGVFGPHYFAGFAIGAHTLYVFKLAAASANGANDGGVAASVRY